MRNRLKTLLLTMVLGLGLTLAGCAMAPQQEPAPQKRSTEHTAPETDKSPAPAHESDDMERLD